MYLRIKEFSRIKLIYKEKVMTSELATNLLPSILVPLVGIMIPAVSIVMLGRYITATE